MEVKEQYTWIIEYPDGKRVSQFKEDGTERAWTEIPLISPFIFHLIPQDQTLPKATLLIDKNKRLIYFRKRVKSYNLGTSEDKFLKTIYVYGWQITEGNKNIKSLNWIDIENKIIYSCDDLNIEVKE
jgi:hypothetical protein